MKMIDTEKLKLLKIGGIILGAILVLGLVFWFSMSSSKSKPAEKVTTKQTKKSLGSELTQTYVKDFLTAYFTKKDLGENRNRYLPFLTEGAYNQEVNHENDPAVQTYKGYVVDMKLKSATIYIDSTDKTVLAQVGYTQTQLQKKGDYTNAQTDVYSKSTLRITYIKQDGKYLVSQIEPILIVDTLTASQSAGLSNLNQPSTSTSTSTGE